MFDLMVPLMISRDSGFSVVCHGDGDSHETCYIQLAEGVRLADLMELWLWEAMVISGGKRNRGFLPTELRYDYEGRLGCKSGLGLVRKGDDLQIYELGELRKTYLFSPLEWWRCVEVRRLKPYRIIGTVPLSSLAAWSDRLEHVVFNAKDHHENIKLSRGIMARNTAALSHVLDGVVGGRSLKKVFPINYMDRIECITRCGRGDRIIEINGKVGDCSFDGEFYFRRDMEELVWWIDMVFRHGDFVVFLNPQGNAGKGVPLFVLKPGDDVAGVLAEMLEKTQIAGKTIDHVAFSAHCELPELLCSGGHVVLPEPRYRRLLKGARRVLLGICKGTGWAEFPLGRIIHQPIPPLFKRNADSTDLLQEASSR